MQRELSLWKLPHRQEARCLRNLTKLSSQTKAHICYLCPAFLQDHNRQIEFTLSFTDIHFDFPAELARFCGSLGMLA
jgi:hypothetical protein